MSEKAERNAAILAGFKAGKTYSELAREHGLACERTRQIIFKQARRAGVRIFTPDLMKLLPPNELRERLNARSACAAPAAPIAARRDLQTIR
jgi:transposase-like protein